jgi:hypothetical protein
MYPLEILTRLLMTQHKAWGELWSSMPSGSFVPGYACKTTVVHHFPSNEFLALTLILETLILDSHLLILVCHRHNIRPEESCGPLFTVYNFPSYEFCGTITLFILGTFSLAYFVSQERVTPSGYACKATLVYQFVTSCILGETLPILVSH